jgi:chemotaxis protein MotB
MLARKCIILWCLPLLLLLGCVSKTKYVALEGELGTTQQKLQAEIDAAEKAIADLNRQKGDLSDENIRLLSTIEALKTELKQEKIAVVEKVIEISEIEKTRREIESSLKEQIEQKEIRLEEVEGKLKVTFVDKILFDSGSIAIKPRGQEVLLTLSESFKERKDQTILVEGHTDNVEIGPVLQAKYPTNWELSTARATAVVRFLQEKGGIEPERMTPAGASYYRPVASNDTPEGRAENRRIEIILVPQRTE